MSIKFLAKPFTALAGKVDHTVQQQIVRSLLRHGATAVGVALVAKGFLAPGAESGFENNLIELAGALLASVGTASGVAQKTQ